MDPQRHQQQLEEKNQEELEGRGEGRGGGGGSGGVCIDVTDRTGELNSIRQPRESTLEDTPQQATATLTHRVMLCADLSSDGFRAESTWVSIPGDSGVPLVAPALRYPATLRVRVAHRSDTVAESACLPKEEDEECSGPDDGTGDSYGSDNHRACESSHESNRKGACSVRGYSYSCAVHVIASLGCQTSSCGRGPKPGGADAIVAAVWAGQSNAVSKLALPRWLHPRSAELRGDGLWCDTSSNTKTTETTPVVVATVPPLAVPPLLLELSDTLGRYYAAVSGSAAAVAGSR